MDFDYITGDRLPDFYRRLSTLKVNTPVLIETFERLLTASAKDILTEMNVGIAVCRLGEYGMYAGIKPTENELLLIVSIERWLQILDRYPESGRYLLEGILVHEKVHVDQLRSGRLAFATDGTASVRWKDETWSMVRSGSGYFNQPWEREAFNVEAQYLIHRGVFTSYRSAMTFLRQTRT